MAATIDPDTLALLVTRARAAWPGVAVDDARFAAWLAARVTDDTPLARLPASDLYLACACAAGDAAALAAFDAAYLREVDIAAAKARAAPGLRDEARQVVRDLLFVARGNRPPAIASYRGRGDFYAAGSA